MVDITQIVAENWPLFLKELAPILMYAIAIVIYGIVIWHFYRKYARRDIFGAKYEEGDTSLKARIKNLFSGFSQLIKYIVLFPVISFVWFVVLAISIFVMSQSLSFETVIMVSAAIVTAIRITAYYSEDLSKDIAKLIPFAILGYFITSPTFFDISILMGKLNAVPEFSTKLIVFFVFIVALEWILHTIHWIYWKIKKAMGEEEEKEYE